MGRNEMIARARSAFREVLEAMETPHAQLLQRDPDIKGLVENIVQHVENARKPENWPVEEYPDDFEKYHPSDRWQWAWLLLQAAILDSDLATILCALRANGCELVPDNTYGYVIRPIIGGHGWRDMQQYNETKEPLNDYIDILLPLLKRLRDAEQKGFVVPQREKQQGKLGEVIP